MTKLLWALDRVKWNAVTITAYVFEVLYMHGYSYIGHLTTLKRSGDKTVFRYILFFGSSFFFNDGVSITFTWKLTYFTL